MSSVCTSTEITLRAYSQAYIIKVPCMDEEGQKYFRFSLDKCWTQCFFSKLRNPSVIFTLFSMFLHIIIESRKKKPFSHSKGLQHCVQSPPYSFGSRNAYVHSFTSLLANYSLTIFQTIAVTTFEDKLIIS